MNKVICFALLGALTAGQAHAIRGADPSKASPGRVAEAMANASKDVQMAEIKKAFEAAKAKVEGSALGKGLTPTQQRQLVKNMIRDKKVNDLASKILADTESKNAELNALAIETLAGRQTDQAKIDITGPNSKDARDAEAGLADALVDAKSWKDADQVNNLKAFTAEYNSQKSKGRSEEEALVAASKKLKETKGIDLDWKKIKELCTKKA